MTPCNLRRTSLLCGILLLLVNFTQAKFTSDPDQVEVISSLDELKLNDVEDPASDLVLPSKFLSKFEEAEEAVAKQLSFRNQNIRASELLTADTENSQNIHKYSSIVLQASRQFANIATDRDDVKIKVISQMKIPEDFCPNAEFKACDPYYAYRSFDGSCNNLANPWWGKSEVPFKRLIQPEYDDKITKPRVKSAVPKHSLPSARTVANIIHAPISSRSDQTSFFLSFGESIARDISSISQILQAGTPKVCTCNSPDPDCFNIPVPKNEKVFTTVDCLPFTRSSVSVKTFDCYLGPREQLNLATSYLDLEQIYGNSADEASKLRAPNGLLKTSRSGSSVTFPLKSEILGCPSSQKTGCYSIGDKRAEESAIITSVHSIWLREHNYLATKLKEINPDWNEEKLFEEARRINIAQYQHIIYQDWLSMLLGDSIWTKYELKPLKSKYNYDYDQALYPSVANEFATSAFGLNHLVSGRISKADARLNSYESADIGTDAYNISAYTRDPDGILRGTLVNGALYHTPQINPTWNNKLYEAINFPTSLGAILNQRGRDHGIPPYHKFRELCGLGKVRTFNDLTNIPKFLVNELKHLYPSVFDIDLYAGAASELPVRGGVVGPTFACIIAKQFYDLKFGDRFFYENGDSRYTRLNVHQLDSIRQTSMARILCTNVLINRIPRNPFLKVSRQNPYIDCNRFKRLDLKPWYVNTTQLAELESLITNLVL